MKATSWMAGVSSVSLWLLVRWSVLMIRSAVNEPSDISTQTKRPPNEPSAVTSWLKVDRLYVHPKYRHSDLTLWAVFLSVTLQSTVIIPPRLWHSYPSDFGQPKAVTNRPLNLGTLENVNFQVLTRKKTWDLPLEPAPPSSLMSVMFVSLGYSLRNVIVSPACWKEMYSTHTYEKNLTFEGNTYEHQLLCTRSLCCLNF
jgi:hypothetical protein